MAVISRSMHRRTSLRSAGSWLFAGAGGLELDAYDAKLGSPPQALLLASSEGHTDVMLETKGNVAGSLRLGMGGSENPNVRADLIYFRTPGGGEVFAVGSIAWCASLSHNNYVNNISRVTDNVLRRFAK